MSLAHLHSCPANSECRRDAALARAEAAERDLAECGRRLAERWTPAHDETMAALVRATTAEADRDAARARVEVLEGALRRMLGTHDGVHSEDCRASGLDDDELPGDPSDADPRCTCGATAVRETARAALAGGEES